MRVEMQKTNRFQMLKKEATGADDSQDLFMPELRATCPEAIRVLLALDEIEAAAVEPPSGSGDLCSRLVPEFGGFYHEHRQRTST
jgi:hypothetical protein